MELFALRFSREGNHNNPRPAFSLMEISLAALPPPPLQRAFHSDPEASQAGSLSAEHLGGMTAAPPPASAYRAPGEATPPPRGRALPSTTLIGFVGCGGGRMPPPSGVAGFRRGGRRAPPPLGCGVCCLGVGVWGRLSVWLMRGCPRCGRAGRPEPNKSSHVGALGGPGSKPSFSALVLPMFLLIFRHCFPIVWPWWSIPAFFLSTATAWNL